MKLVIEIDEERYNYVKGQVEKGIDNPLKVIIANGTPLPTDAVDRVTIKEYLYSLGMDIKVTTADGVLDKIRAEIDSHCSDNRDRNDGLYIAMRIIDKYQASQTGAEGG